jgi:hypothetical protein
MIGRRKKRSHSIRIIAYRIDLFIFYKNDMNCTERDRMMISSNTVKVEIIYGALATFIDA